MKKILTISILCICCLFGWAQTNLKLNPDLQTVDDGFFDPTKTPEKEKEDYHFGIEYRIEGGYIQTDMRVPNDTLRYGFLHGGRIGATVNFLLPYRLSLQTGLLYSLSYGRHEQHFHSMDAESAQVEALRKGVMQHNLTIPVRLYYTIPLWKKLNLFFYTGPQMQIGLAEQCKVDASVSEATAQWLEQNGIHTGDYDRLSDGELRRFNIQYGIGGGLEWDCYRLQGGYDFGLNNLYKRPLYHEQKMWEWQWSVMFSYRF